MFRLLSVILATLVALPVYAESQFKRSLPLANRDLTTIDLGEIIIGYDEARNNPAWVAYYIPPMAPDADIKTPKRPSRFTKAEGTQEPVTHDDYTNSGYDRGHMAPNFAIASRFGKEAQKDTFSMANIVPQNPKLNRYVWRELEAHIAFAKGLVNKRAGLWVITGPIFSQDPKYIEGRSGNRIEVPVGFFKILLDDKDNSVETKNDINLIAFILPQNPTHKVLADYVVPVDLVEKLTGLDFFPELEDSVELKEEGEKEEFWEE